MYQEVILTAILSLILYAMIITRICIRRIQTCPLHRVTVLDTSGVPVPDKVA